MKKGEQDEQERGEEVPEETTQDPMISTQTHTHLVEDDHVAGADAVVRGVALHDACSVPTPQVSH